MTIPVTLALFAGGGAAGAALAKALAPGSVVGAFFGLFMLPAAFIGGFYAWLGLALLDAIGSFVRRGGRRIPRDTAKTPVAARAIPRGSIGFVFVSLAVSIMTGFALAFLATESKFLTAWSLLVAAGTGYGVLCWLLARSGFLPFPEGD